MAKPVEFLEQNATHTPAIGEYYPVWVRPYDFAEQQTIDVISVWQLTSEEIETVEDTGVIFLRVVGFQPPVEICLADPTEFEGQSFPAVHPECRDLPVREQETTYNGRKMRELVSAWALSPEGWKVYRENGYRITLRVVGGQPDGIEVFGINPITE